MFSALGISPRPLTPAKDTVGCRRNLTKYSQEITFSSTRECKLVDNLINACDGNDTDAFTDVTMEYDQVMKLDNWKTTILLKIKRSINVDEL